MLRDIWEPFQFPSEGDMFLRSSLNSAGVSLRWVLWGWALPKQNLIGNSDCVCTYEHTHIYKTRAHTYTDTHAYIHSNLHASTHTHTHDRPFCITAAYVTYLNFGISSGVERESETTKCSETMTSTTQHPPFAFLHLSTDIVLCSILDANYNKW